jgi:hypothetical protein
LQLHWSRLVFSWRLSSRSCCGSSWSVMARCGEVVEYHRLFCLVVGGVGNRYRRGCLFSGSGI